MENNSSDPIETQTPRRRFSARERAKHLSRWERSELSAPDYAARNGLEGRHLYNWKSQQRKREGKAGKSDLIPVRLTGMPVSSQVLSVTVRHRDIEYVIDGTSDPRLLVSVVQALKQEVLDV